MGKENYTGMEDADTEPTKREKRPKASLIASMVLAGLGVGAPEVRAQSDEVNEPSSVNTVRAERTDYEEWARSRKSELETLTPGMEKDIERWIQKDFFHNLDTLKYLAENDLSAIEITRELENLRNTKDEVFEGLESLGVRAHSSRKLIPNYLKEKENDAPPFLMPGFMKYEEPTDEEFEPEGGLHTAEDVLNTMVGKTKAYEVWLRDKIRDIYQRYESIRNITLSTNYTFDEDVARLYSGAMKLDLNNSLGTVFEVVQAENKGMAILPDYITTAKFRLPSSVEGEFPTIRGVNIYPINTNSSRSIVIYPFLNSEFEELMKCEFGPAFHYNRGLAVIDLAPGQKFNNKEEWVEFLGNTLGKFGYIAERTTELNWKDKLKDKAKPDENSDR